MPTRRQLRSARRRRFLAKAHYRAGRDPRWIARALRRPLAEICGYLRLPVPARRDPRRATIHAVLRRLRSLPAIRTFTDLADWCGCEPKHVKTVLADWPDREAVLALLADRTRRWKEEPIAALCHRLVHETGRPPSRAQLKRAGASITWIMDHYGSLTQFLTHLGLPAHPPPRCGPYRADQSPRESHAGLASPDHDRHDPGGTPDPAHLPESVLCGPEIRGEGQGV